MGTSAKPSLRFFHSPALRTRTTKVLSAIDKDEDATKHVGALSGVVVDLTEAGLDYYFLKPLQQAKIGFVPRQTANLGMAGALRVMSPIIRRILAAANTTQLRVIAGHIRHLMQWRVDERAAQQLPLTKEPPSISQTAAVAIYPGHLSLSAAAWNAKQDNKKYVVRHPPNADQDVALNPELPVNEVCPTQLIRSTDWRQGKWTDC